MVLGEEVASLSLMAMCDEPSRRLRNSPEEAKLNDWVGSLQDRRASPCPVGIVEAFLGAERCPSGKNGATIVLEVNQRCEDMVVQAILTKVQKRDVYFPRC